MGMAQEQKQSDKALKHLSDGQRETYDKLLAMNLKNVTQQQLIKAAEEFGTNVDGAVNYLAYDDPDKGDDIGEPNFLTSLSHSNKVGSVDKKQIPKELKNENKKDDK